MLTLATTAMLAGARSVTAVAQWGRLQSPATVLALGFTRPRSPCGSTFHLVFAALDAVAFETALTQWALVHLGDAEEEGADHPDHTERAQQRARRGRSVRRVAPP